MKTLSDLKRDAKAGILSIEMTEWYGKTGDGIKESLRGVKKVVGSNSVGIFIDRDGRKSELRLPSANLVEYSDNELIVYNPGLRPLSEEEQTIIDQWKHHLEEFNKRNPGQLENEIYTDGNTEYYLEKSFFSERGFNYLRGFDTEKGCRFDHNTKMVIDNKIKGEIVLKYNIYNSKELDKDFDLEIEKE